MSNHFIDEVELITVECCNCHMLFAVTKGFNDERRKDHEYFYCPAGHAQHYPGKSNEQKLRERLEEEQRCCISAREEANAIERRLRATRGVVTKLKKKQEAADGD